MKKNKFSDDKTDAAAPSAEPKEQKWGIDGLGVPWAAHDNVHAERFAGALRYKLPVSEPKEHPLSQYVRCKEQLLRFRTELATELERIDEALSASEPTAIDPTQKPKKPELKWLRRIEVGLYYEYEAKDFDKDHVSVHKTPRGVVINAPRQAVGLTRDMSRELAELLAYYAKTGELP